MRADLLQLAADVARGEAFGLAVVVRRESARATASWTAAAHGRGDAGVGSRPDRDPLRRTIHWERRGWESRPRWAPRPPSPARSPTRCRLSGVTRIDIPITPEKIWRILRDKGVAE